MPHWPESHDFDGKLKFIVPSHDTVVPMKGATLVVRAL